MRWLEMIPIALGFIVLATGIGMLLSALYVRFRDIAADLGGGCFRRGSTARPIMYLASAYQDRFGIGLRRSCHAQPAPPMLLTQMGHAFIGGCRASRRPSRRPAAALTVIDRTRASSLPIVRRSAGGSSPARRRGWPRTFSAPDAQRYGRSARSSRSPSRSPTLGSTRAPVAPG